MTTALLQCLHTCHASVAENLFSLIRIGKGGSDREMTPRQMRWSLVLLVLLPYLQRKFERLCAPQLSIGGDEVCPHLLRFLCGQFGMGVQSVLLKLQSLL